MICNRFYMMSFGQNTTQLVKKGQNSFPLGLDSSYYDGETVVSCFIITPLGSLHHFLSHSSHFFILYFISVLLLPSS